MLHGHPSLAHRKIPSFRKCFATPGIENVRCGAFMDFRRQPLGASCNTRQRSLLCRSRPSIWRDHAYDLGPFATLQNFRCWRHARPISDPRVLYRVCRRRSRIDCGIPRSRASMPGFSVHHCALVDNQGEQPTIQEITQTFRLARSHRNGRRDRCAPFVGTSWAADCIAGMPCFECRVSVNEVFPPWATA
jgi:hypothetical protein